jgi:hypothetical protein
VFRIDRTVSSEAPADAPPRPSERWRRIMNVESLCIAASAQAAKEAGGNYVACDSLCGPFGDPNVEATCLRVTSLSRAIRSNTWVWFVRNVHSSGCGSLSSRRRRGQGRTSLSNVATRDYS